VSHPRYGFNKIENEKTKEMSSVLLRLDRDIYTWCGDIGATFYGIPPSASSSEGFTLKTKDSS
jgi:hypothetical protein